MSNIDLVLNETEETAPEDEEAAPALDLEGTTDLDEDQSVPRRRRPNLRDRDAERSVARRTRSSSRAPPEAGLVWPVPREAIPRRRRPATTERDPARAADGERTSRFRC